MLGPYGSDSTRAVAAARSGAVVWNHGAAADDVQRLAGVVSVPTPASRYLVALGRAVAELRPGARIACLAAPGRFARFAREGLERELASLGLELAPASDEAEAVLLCGPVEWEVPRLRALARPGLLLGGVSPGLASFPDLLGGDPDGLLGTVQWHPGLRYEVELGPARVPLEDYVAAQAYAAALVAARCLELSPNDPLAAARDLRTTTFFGRFELAADGLQAGHRLAVVRWRRGARRILLPEAA